MAATEPYDFLISPTSPITPYAAEEATPGDDPAKPFEHIAFTAPFNQSEQPAASLCAGYDEDGLPIGLQIVGHRFDDLGVLRMARAYEGMRPKLRPWKRCPCGVLFTRRKPFCARIRVMTCGSRLAPRSNGRRFRNGSTGKPMELRWRNCARGWQT